MVYGLLIVPTTGSHIREVDRDRFGGRGGLKVSKKYRRTFWRKGGVPLIIIGLDSAKVRIIIKQSSRRSYEEKNNW